MKPEPLYAKIDLHCHSWASDRPSLWMMQRLGCPESFISPEDVRQNAMLRGMDFVTITDHNTCKGVKEIERYDNVIVGQEVTSYFPGDIKVHIVCLDITDDQQKEIHSVRENVYDLVQYLNGQAIIHFMAHPLNKVNGKLTWDEFEKSLLLFKRFEILNGTRLRRVNSIQEQIITSLTKEAIDRLANKHNIEPVGDRPWEKFVTGGSDDHSGLFVGTCFTDVEVESMTKRGLLDGIRQGRTRPRGSNDGILTLAHQVNSIAFQYYRSKIGPESGELFHILGRIFERNRPLRIPSKLRFRKGLKRLFKYFWRPKGSKINLIEEIREIISNNIAFRSLYEEGLMTQEEYNHNVFNLASDVLDQMIVRVCEKPQLLHYFIVFAPTVLASYMMVCRNLHSERDLIERGEAWLGIRRKPKVAWFTDSFVNMDGVSKTCRAFLEAGIQRDRDLTIVTCHTTDLSSQDNVINFKPVREFTTPGYENVKLFVPSVLKVLQFMVEQEFDSVVVSTPGPVGIIGLICAKMIRLPVHGIYHTDLPRIALQVSGDATFGELALHLTRMFYKHTDLVLSPSKWYLEDIENLGIPLSKTRILERWVDPNVFSPSRRDARFWKDASSCRLLYTGRISKDKNIDLLVKLYEKLAEKYDDFTLYCVGDGPYFKELRRKVSAYPRFILTGAMFGNDLATAYASADLFVYPGLLDTFGNVVIEAQASGLPCIVMNEGGPQELVKPVETGIVARSEMEFISVTENLLVDKTRRERMARQAAAYAKERFSEEKIFTGFWETVTGPVPDDKNKPEFQFDMTRNQKKVINL